MKKSTVLAIIAIALIALMFIILFFSIAPTLSLFWNYADKDADDALTYGYNRIAWIAAAEAYYFDGDTSDMTITIPDKFGIYPIVKLGYVCGSGEPTPFRIALPDSYQSGTIHHSLAEDEIASADITYLDFTLYLGKNINEIDIVDMGYHERPSENGNAFYAPRVYIICDKENKTFYSKDGKLYLGKDGSLVDDFLYVP